MILRQWFLRQMSPHEVHGGINDLRRTAVGVCKAQGNPALFALVNMMSARLRSEGRGVYPIFLGWGLGWGLGLGLARKGCYRV